MFKKKHPLPPQWIGDVYIHLNTDNMNLAHQENKKTKTHKHQIKSTTFPLEHLEKYHFFLCGGVQFSLLKSGLYTSKQTEIWSFRMLLMFFWINPKDPWKNVIFTYVQLMFMSNLGKYTIPWSLWEIDTESHKSTRVFNQPLRSMPSLVGGFFPPIWKYAQAKWVHEPRIHSLKLT